jgi:replicative DNA helicase
VLEKAQLRRLIERTSSAMQLAFDADRPASEIAAELQRDVLGLSVNAAKDGFVRMKDDIWAVMDDLEARARGEGTRRMIPTGYRDIDERIAGGFERGHFIVFSGVPGSGKTAAALNILLNVAIESPNGAAFVSAEMTRAQVITRSLANIGRVNLTALRKGELRDDDYPRLARAAGILGGAASWVDHTPTPDINAVVAKCRKLKAEHPELGLLVVDYIQLVQRRFEKQGGGRRQDANRSAELTDISYTLQGLGKELDVAVLATSQVDASGIEKREDKRPTLGDARWSQGMREAAHLFATVFRPKMYDPDAFDTIELAFQKGRDDPPFTALFDWQGQFMRMNQRGVA